MKFKPLSLEKSGLDKNEYKKLKSLSTPRKVQDFLNSIPFNFEKNGQTHHSPRYVLKENVAHCFEGALLAALAFWVSGKQPLLLDLKTVRPDFDHVVTLFQENGCWGAVSKTNHSVLRYRDPIYKTVRELAISYFHEYFLLNGKKTLREYSKPFNLSKINKEWITTDENLADLAHKLDVSKHFKIISLQQARLLRKAEQIEVEASNLCEYKA